MSTESYANPAAEARYTERVHLRLPSSLGREIETAFASRSTGLRAAIRYAVAEAPLPSWPVAAPTSDLVDGSTTRASVRVSPAMREDLAAVAALETAPDRSRAIRDGARALLADQ
jgi:metal-responsive CopG/Arc/MetJ family transcriptional regulator